MQEGSLCPSEVGSSRDGHSGRQTIVMQPITIDQSSRHGHPLLEIILIAVGRQLHS